MVYPLAVPYHATGPAVMSPPGHGEVETAELAHAH